MVGSLNCPLTVLVRGWAEGVFPCLQSSPVCCSRENPRKWALFSSPREAEFGNPHLRSSACLPSCVLLHLCTRAAEAGSFAAGVCKARKEQSPSSRNGHLPKEDPLVFWQHEEGSGI